MSKLTIGIVDYDVGNHASVGRSVRLLGYRCRISSDPDMLATYDLLILPGVGAFPAAMKSLHRHGLVDFLADTARSGKPLLGVCLGMQLLADISHEQGTTRGLALIPGEVGPIGDGRWHIGWNSIEMTLDDPPFRASDGETMYFNHRYHFDCDPQYRVAVATVDSEITAIVRRDNVVGIQFHPEKSQVPGQLLLKNVIEGLCDA